MKKYVLLLAAIAVVASCSSKKPVTFAYLTDVHLCADSPRIANLEKCIADINSRDDIQFVIFGGDITEFGSDEEIAMAKGIIDKLTLPTYVLAGNHDAKWSESGCNTFAKVFGYEKFEFEAGGIKFLGCNSGPNMRMAPALLPHECLVWLDSTMKATPKNKKIIFVNHFPQDTSMLNYFQVINTLKEGNIQMLIGGHWHTNTILDYDGVPGILGRSPDKNKEIGYNVVSIANDSIKVAERIIADKDGNPVTVNGEPWFAMAMHDEPLFEPETPSDGNRFGLPDNYPFLKFDVNAKYPQVKTVWESQDISDIGSGAVKVGNLVLYTNTQGCIKAINFADGTPVWSYATGGKTYSTPASDGKHVVAGSTDGYIYCLSIADGSLLWRYQCSKSVLASPVIQNGIVYQGSSDHVFRALNIETGELVWQFDGVKGFVECKPFIDNEQVVFGDWANTLYSLNPQNGALQWKWVTKGSRMYSPAAVYPVKANGRIFIALPDRKTYAINAKTGETEWSERGGRESIALSLDGDKVFVKAMHGYMEAFSTKPDWKWKVWETVTRKDGMSPRLWEAVVPGQGYDIAPTPCASALDNGREVIFEPTDKGNIFCLDAADGSLLWSHKVSVALINSIVPLPDRQLLVCTMDGVVTLLTY